MRLGKKSPAGGWEGTRKGKAAERTRRLRRRWARRDKPERSANVLPRYKSTSWARNRNVNKRFWQETWN